MLWQVLGNLIAKAATAPFALIGAALGGGGGEEMNYVEFPYGRATLDAPAEEKLKKMGAALTDRPALQMEIAGYVEKEKDLEGLRMYRFERKLKVQKRGDEEEQAEDASLDRVTIAQEEYLKYLTFAYKNESFPKPRNLIGLAKDLPQEEMENLILTHIEVTDDDLQELAKRRAQVVREYLLSEGKLDAGRMFLVEPKAISLDNPGEGRGSRVVFAIK